MRALDTFDCFDTVITRGVGGSRGASHVLAEHLRREAFPGLAGRPAEVVVTTHLLAEHLAYRRHGERRSLAHSSAQWAELLGLPASAAAGLRAAEEAVELALNRPVPSGRRRVRAARAAGAQVGFLSDTAISSALLGSMLRGSGVLEDGDLLWTSNELGAEKGQGRAYRAVLGTLDPARRPAAGGWRHTGDDARSDVLMARLSGVRGVGAPAGRLTGWERALEAAAASTGGVSSALAGASRRARLELEDDSARTAVVTGVVGPVLAGLAVWALQRATTAGRSLELAGPGAGALAAVAAPLAAVLAPGLVVRRSGGSGEALVLCADVVPAPAAGGLHLGVADDTGADSAGASGGAEDRTTTGYLRDAVAGTGLSGSRAVLPDVAAALTAATSADDAAALAVFGEELAGVLPLLVTPGEPVPDLRGALEEVLHRFWTAPGSEAAQSWHAPMQALPGGWPEGRTALAGRPQRLVRRAAAAAVRRAGPKVVRARVLAAGRLPGAARRGA